VSVDGLAFVTTLVACGAGIIASTRGAGRSAFLVLTALFLLSSWFILRANGAGPGTDGQGMMWGIMFVGYFWSVILMFVLRKRTDAIF
jgi:hypothetical protein